MSNYYPFAVRSILLLNVTTTHIRSKMSSLKILAKASIYDYNSSNICLYSHG